MSLLQGPSLLQMMMANTRISPAQEKRDLEFLARVASLYYEDQKTQASIAQELGYSRSAISRFLSAAREAGLVEIRVHHPLRRDGDLEAALRERFGLQEANVLIRDSRSYTRMLSGLGDLGARMLERRASNGFTLGVSWGTAIYEVASALRPPFLPGTLVLQLLGALGTPDPQIDGGELAQSFARRFGGRYRILPAPAIVDSPRVRNALMRDRPVREVLDLAREVECAVVGIGTTDPGMSSLVRAQYLTKAELREVADAGAVGDICAIHFDVRGKILDIPIAKRVVGIEPKDLRRIPFKIGVAGGKTKAPAILGGLRSGLVDSLVTDDEAAREVLKLDAD